MPNKASNTLFIMAGEPSGDLHAANVVKALRSLDPSIAISGIAGPKMRELGIQGSLQSEQFAVMGLTDVIAALPRLIKGFSTVKNEILAMNPTGVLLVDYASFNLRMAKSLRKAGYKGKIIQYISPSVWAWGKERCDQMAKHLDQLLAIYPFEKNCFSHTSLKVDYIGNPLSEYLESYCYDEDWNRHLKIAKKLPIVALFPGSRVNEIDRHLPLMLKACSQLKANDPKLIFGLSAAHRCIEDNIHALLAPFPNLKESLYLVPQKFSYELMKASRIALAKSGTVTLELALHGCPTVVLYQLTRLNRWYAKNILKVNLPHYCIVNILAGNAVYPEFIGCDLDERPIVAALLRLHASRHDRISCIKGCQSIRHSLGTVKASQKAAMIIEKLLRETIDV